MIAVVRANAVPSRMVALMQMPSLSKNRDRSTLDSHDAVGHDYQFDMRGCPLVINRHRGRRNQRDAVHLALRKLASEPSRRLATAGVHLDVAELEDGNEAGDERGPAALTV